MFFFYIIIIIVLITITIIYNGITNIEPFNSDFNSDIPKTFNFERWIENPETTKELIYYDKETNNPSLYQDIQIVQFDKDAPNNIYGFDKCLLLGNEVQFCSNDEKRYHETIVHFPAAYLEKIEYVLIIGGGDLMTLREVMKYENTIIKVDMLELDEKVIKVSQEFFLLPDDDYSNHDKVNLVIGDATVTINDFPDYHYDLIIMDATEDSYNNSPLDTRNFFSICKKKLKRNENNQCVGIFMKNGNINDRMTTSEKNKKQKINDTLNELYFYVGFIEINMATYEDSNTYGFIMCSDIIDIKEVHEDLSTIKNNTLKKIENLEYYSVDKHHCFYTTCV